MIAPNGREAAARGFPIAKKWRARNRTGIEAAPAAAPVVC